ncbi:MAG TPA: hypothetical protein VFG78_11835 [Gemmatimonadota bacterium]|nr:hypothetical protein [Gemmatimonadota bacterium]
MELVRKTRFVALTLLAGTMGWACSGGAEAESIDAASEMTKETAVTTPTAVTASTEEGSIEGQVIDVSCYLAQGLKGDAHRQCAEICANQLGIPLNVLDDEGYLWQLVDDDMPGHDQNPTVVQYAEQRVRATGTLIEKGATRAIIVKDVALLEGTANPTALANSSDPELGKTFNTKPAANPCAGKTNPCAGKANPCAANPCGGQ